MNPAIHPEVRIGHVHLTVSNLERALEFYRDALGFEVTQKYGASAAFLSEMRNLAAAKQNYAMPAMRKCRITLAICRAGRCSGQDRAGYCCFGL